MRMGYRLGTLLFAAAGLAACTSQSDNATYPPLSAGSLQPLPVVVASPGGVAPTQPPQTGCATAGRIVVTVFPTSVCLDLGEKAEVVLPAFIGPWTKPDVTRPGVIRIRKVRSTRGGDLTFDLEATGMGSTVVHSHTQPPGEAPTKGAELRVTVLG